MKKYLLTKVAIFLFATTHFSQQLLINEVSQGTSNAEYIEFVVAGDFSCSTETCLDLRNLVFDDNNGPANSGSVSTGAMRFANIDFWACIPQGTLLVIYDADNKNASLPSDDLTMEDGNYALIIPSNSELFEHNTVAPNGSLLVSTYQNNDAWVSGGNWNTIRMQNATDMVQIPSSMTGINPDFSLAWGSANGMGSINFQVSAEGKVFAFENNTNDDVMLQANWTARGIAEGQTPGKPNSPENQKWIQEMNRNYGTVSNLSALSSLENEQCFNTCDGAILTQTQGGYAPYTFEWSNGETGNNLQNLCPGQYDLRIVDAKGCEYTTSFEIETQNNAGLAEFAVPGELASGENTQYETQVEGGLWSATCGTCIDQDGIFNSSISGVGTFEITHIVGVGECSDTATRIQTVNGHFQNSLPNVFSPNGDGVNDFIDFRANNSTVLSGRVFDRWGNVVYEYRQGNPRWFGKNLNGDRLKNGSYFYRFVYQDASVQDEITIQGFITLVE